MQELLKCLAHASLQPDENSGDAGDVNIGSVNNNRNSDSDNSSGEEADDKDEEGASCNLRCPICKQEPKSLKKLRRHFAIRTATHHILKSIFR